MSALGATTQRRFYRDADRACLGGVCAGLADYLDFNLKTTRILAIVAFFMAMPMAIVAYLAVVFLVPSVSRMQNGDAFQRPLQKCRKSRKTRTADEITSSPVASEIINSKCGELERRLVQLERRVTSRRFQLEQEFDRL